MSLHECPQATHPKEFTLAPSNDPSKRVYRDDLKWLSRMSLHGCPQRTRSNEFTWAPTRPKRRHKGELDKRARWMCTKPTSSLNLAFFIQACVPRYVPTLNDPTEQVYMNALKRPSWTSLHGRSWTTCPNEFTRMPSIDPPKQVHTDSLKWLTQTTCLNQFTWTPSNDPPEWVYTDPLKRPAWTSLHRWPQTTRLNDPLEWVDMEALKQPTWTSLHGHPHDRNEGTRERLANEL